MEMPEMRIYLQYSAKRCNKVGVNSPPWWDAGSRDLVFTFWLSTLHSQPYLNILLSYPNGHVVYLLQLHKITSLSESNEDQWHRSELPDERAEEGDCGRPVGDGGREVGDDEEQLVRRVATLRPFVELHASLEQGREGEDDAVDLDQAPVPFGRLFCNVFIC